jgi:thiosulfate/3-mercaptopyruvate sulfurtransferase
LELYEKIYVYPSFLKTDHGQIACEQCHGGEPKDPNWQTAHKDIVKDPTFPKADEVCGECHEDIVKTAQNSVHYTLAPFDRIIRARANKKSASTLRKVSSAKEKHCDGCHASCGQCHVSRPNYVAGGFLKGHLFQKKPPVDTTCASCHGGRVFGEYTGLRDGFPADVHFEKKEMTCMDCHTKKEMHADATFVNTRFDLPERPKCQKCHPTVVSENPKIRSHKIHKNKVACQVCHALANKNCFSCHVGTDSKGIPYFKCKETKILFKVGLNPNRTKERPEAFTVLRHPPADPGLFDSYTKNALTDFDKIPTWKLDTPHTIRRITPQNRACNNCHGNASLFLQAKELPESERKANAKVVVPVTRLPKPIKEVMQ